MKNQSPNLPEELAMEYAIEGLRNTPLSNKLARKPPKTIQQMCRKFEEYCRSDEDYNRRKQKLSYGSPQTARVNLQENRNFSKQREQAKGTPETVNQINFGPMSSNQPTSSKGKAQQNTERQQRKPYCIYCGEDMGHKTLQCPKAKEIMQKIQQEKKQASQAKMVNHSSTTSWHPAQNQQSQYQTLHQGHQNNHYPQPYHAVPYFVADYHLQPPNIQNITPLSSHHVNNHYARQAAE